MYAYDHEPLPLFTFDPSAYQIAMRDWEQHQQERIFGGNDMSKKAQKVKIRCRFVIGLCHPQKTNPMKGAILISLSCFFFFFLSSYRFAYHCPRLKSKGPPNIKPKNTGFLDWLISSIKNILQLRKKN